MTKNSLISSIRCAQKSVSRLAPSAPRAALSASRVVLDGCRIAAPIAAEPGVGKRADEIDAESPRNLAGPRLDAVKDPVEILQPVHFMPMSSMARLPRSACTRREGRWLGPISRAPTSTTGCPSIDARKPTRPIPKLHGFIADLVRPKQGPTENTGAIQSTVVMDGAGAMQPSQGRASRLGA